MLHYYQNYCWLCFFKRIFKPFFMLNLLRFKFLSLKLRANYQSGRSQKNLLFCLQAIGRVPDLLLVSKFKRQKFNETSAVFRYGHHGKCSGCQLYFFTAYRVFNCFMYLVIVFFSAKLGSIFNYFFLPNT